VCVKWELLLPVLSFVCVCAWSVLVLPQVGRPFDPFRADDARRWLVIQAAMGMTPGRGATPHSCAAGAYGIYPGVDDLALREAVPDPIGQSRFVFTRL
jgi:hypothetical protein